MNAPKQYRRKPPTIVEALKWTGTNGAEINAWTGGGPPYGFHAIDPEDRGDDPDATGELYDSEKGRWVPLADGDWVVLDGCQLSKCTPEEFEETYEPCPSDTLRESLESRRQTV